MTFQDRCLKEFDAVIRARGEDDFRSQNVSLKGASTSAAQFQIQGKEMNSVYVDWSALDEKGLLRIHCSCRSFLRGEFCQHIWATLLELDRTGQAAAAGANPRVLLARTEPRAIQPVAVTQAPLKTSESVQPVAKVVPSVTPAPAAIPGWKSALFKSDFAPQGQVETAISSRRALLFVNLERSRQAGVLAVELKYQERLKSGDWGAVKTGRFDPQVLSEFTDDIDRKTLGLLLSPVNASSAGARGAKTPDQLLEVDEVMVGEILEQTTRSERLFVLPKTSDESLSELAPLVFGEGEWSFQIDVKDEETAFALVGVLRRGRERIPLKNSELAIFRSGFFLQRSSVERVAWEGVFELARHLSAHSILIPKKDEVDFVMTIASRTDLPQLNFPLSLQWPLHEASPLAFARIQKTDEQQASYRVEALMAYDNLKIDPASPQKFLFDPEKRIRIKRDGKTEKGFVSGLKGPNALKRLSKEEIKTADLPDLVQMLLASAWKIEIEGQTVAALERFEGGLQKAEENFVLKASFEVAGPEAGQAVRIPLRAVVAACSRGDRFISYGESKVAFVSEEWAKRVELLLRGALFDKEGNLVFTRASIPLFRPVFEDIPGLNIDAEVKQVFDGLGRLLEPGMAEKPRELKANLRSYQGEGLAWLERITASGFGGILADDMGLGKTIQVISYLLRRATVPRTGPRPSLVVLPKSLVFNWIGEIEKFGPRLRVLDFAGANRGMLKAHDYDVVVTTYHVLKNELDRFEKIEFDTIILDEAQAIKNPGSQVAKAVFQLKARYKFALSGTPIENSLGDLFSLMRFANPGLIPSGLETSIGQGRSGSLSKESLQRLSIAVSPFVLRRTKKQVLKELPDKTEQALVCELEGEQKKMYDRLRRHYRDSLKKEISSTSGSKMQVLEALLRLRQACCHPGLVDPNLASKSSAKFDVLLEHLEEIKASGNKALIFSQFTSFLGLLKPHLEKAGIRFEYLDGQTRDRGAVVDRFNSDPSTTVFLISLKAGGTGLNLTTASYVFLLDPWWNPAIESQAIDRAYRMGQKQKVMAYRLIAEGTIEEKIMRLQAQKRSLAEAVISEDQSFLRSLSVEDLAGLFE